MARSVLDRLQARSERADGCLVWQGAIGSHGYGAINIAGRIELVHRVAYRELVGPISEGLFVLHRCDNPPCWEPTHLFLGTHLDNARDASEKGRLIREKGTHCKHGHEFTEANTYRWADGARHCRACHRDAQKRYLRKG